MGRYDTSTKKAYENCIRRIRESIVLSEEEKNRMIRNVENYRDSVKDDFDTRMG